MAAVSPPQRGRREPVVDHVPALELGRLQHLEVGVGQHRRATHRASTRARASDRAGARPRSVAASLWSPSSTTTRSPGDAGHLGDRGCADRRSGARRGGRRRRRTPRRRTAAARPDRRRRAPCRERRRTRPPRTPGSRSRRATWPPPGGDVERATAGRRSAPGDDRVEIGAFAVDRAVAVGVAAVVPGVGTPRDASSHADVRPLLHGPSRRSAGAGRLRRPAPAHSHVASRRDYLPSSASILRTPSAASSA